MVIAYKDIRFILAIIIYCFGSFFLVQQCVHKSPKTVQKTENTAPISADTVKIPGDSFPYLVHDTIPGAVIIDTLPVPADADTAAIIAQFLTRLIYDSTFKQNDFLIRYRINLSRNKIDSLKIWVQNLRETALVTNKFETKKPQRKLYAGLEFGGNKTFFGGGPGIIYQDKKERLFQFKYDAFNRMYWLGTYAPLNF